MDYALRNEENVGDSLFLRANSSQLFGKPRKKKKHNRVQRTRSTQKVKRKFRVEEIEVKMAAAAIRSPAAPRLLVFSSF